MSQADPVDQEVRDLVSRAGLDRTLFVEAGAGTGKTHQLVERIGALVLDKGVPLARIAAITFTEAAAAELAARVRVHFEQALAAEPPGERRDRCAIALGDLDRAALSTLHGFANRLLTERAVDAGLPPRLVVLDEVSSQLAFEERWARFVDAVYDDPANAEVLVRAELVGVALEPRYPGHGTLKSVAAALGDNWDRLEDTCPDDPGPIGPIDTTPFDQAVSAFERTLATCTDPTDKFHRHATEVVLPQVQVLRSLDPDRMLAELYAHSRGRGWGRGSGGRDAAWGGDVKAAKDHVDRLNEAVQEVVARAAHEVLARLFVLVRAEVLAAAEARRREGTLEYHDLLVLARDLLRRRDGARASLHEQFTHLLLDEFQDTDPIQIELAVLIAGSFEGVADEHWSRFDIELGRLFFVGDPKQSIYRFRRADIALYLAARDRFGDAGGPAVLTTNFRTVGPVLDCVNTLFSSLMATEIPGCQPRYEPLHPWRETRAGSDHRPVLLGGPHEGRVLAADLRAAEAADVAAVVASVGAHPEGWPVQDPVTGHWRPARYDDVAILVPARTSLPYLREALEARGLPYRLATGTLVYDTQEVRDALAALRSVDDPTDQLSLVAALRSPLYACSDVDLFTYRQAGGRWDLRRDPPDSVPVDHPVRVGLAHLRSLWEERWWTTPSALVDRLLGDRRATLLAFGDRRPFEVWGRLRFLVDQARAFEEAGGGDLRDFLAWADLQASDTARVHEPLLPETDEQAVRILTIHGAKGLEFPITILSGMTTEPGRARLGVSLVWGDDGLPQVSLRKGVATANHAATADLEAEMDQHEKVRLLYVAATRARDHLVVACHHKAGGPDTYARRVWDELAPHPDRWRSRPDELIPPVRDAAPSTGVGTVESDAEAARRAAWVADRRALLESSQHPRVVSATTLARSAGPGGTSPDADTDTDYDTDYDPDTDTDHDHDTDTEEGAALVARRRGRAGTAVGRATHATLQVVDLADPHDLEAQVRRQCELEAVPELADTVEALVRSALASQTVRTAAALVHHREIYVAAPVGDRVVEGYVDLLVETPQGLLVVDYKTDAVRTEAEVDAKLAGYERQAAAYALALEQATGLVVQECRFVFCRAAGAVERSVADLAGVMDRVREAVAAL